MDDLHRELARIAFVAGGDLALVLAGTLHEPATATEWDPYLDE